MDAAAPTSHPPGPDAAHAGRLPTFLVIGGQKCGTSWLGHHLSQHPDVFLPPGEVHYFTHADRWARGVDWYRDHFCEATTERAVGEKTPNYLWVTDHRVGPHMPGVHRRVHQLLPDARLVAIVREPVSRAISALRHQVRAGRIPPLDPEDLLLGRHRHVAEAQGILDMGRYAVGLEAFLELYPRDQLLVLVHEEDVVADPRRGLQRVCDFLGVDPGFAFRDPDVPRGVGEARPAVAPVLRRLPTPARRWASSHLGPWGRADLPPMGIGVQGRLYDWYARDNERLFCLLGRVPRGWEAP